MASPVLPSVIEAPPPEGGGPRNYNDNYILHWNDVGLDLIRLTHTVPGHQSGPPLSARFLGILHLAIHDAYFAVFPYGDHSNTVKEFVEDFTPFLSASALDTVKLATIPSANATEAKNAVAGAAITVLNKLFKSPDKRDPGVSQQATAIVSEFLDASIRAFQKVHTIRSNSAAYTCGVAIANLILNQLEIKGSEPGVDAVNYMPNSHQPYWFDDDPSNPIRVRPIDPDSPERGNKFVRPYHAPFYGTSATVFATTKDIKIADPPLNPSEPPDLAAAPTVEYSKYLEAVEDVHRMGGAEDLATTKRQPAQTAAALFWAYDGVNLIGTPPRLYNQIVKQIAFDKRMPDGLNSDENNAQFVRLLALANVAMADAGIFCWREKYKYELWRPLTGVRADPTGPVPGGFGRPTWRVLGAPSTNSNERSFKPPFPAYPSGHATFAAAAFQMVRLFYHQRGDVTLHSDEESRVNDKQQQAKREQQTPIGSASPRCSRDTANDSISFNFISDELNGISRTLYQAYDPKLPLENQPGDIRTRVPVAFSSLKEAIFANGMSRIWLGVHWHFDGFAGETVFEKYEEGSPDGRDDNQPRPNGRKQLFKVAEDGSTMYQDVGKMDWFAAESLGPRDGEGRYPVGGVPLGMLIADNIFDNRMRSCGTLVDLGNNITVTRD